MSEKQKAKLRIKASYIGPIFSLDKELSHHRQNLIFATNGTGKSFLARGLRILDKFAYNNIPEKTLIPESIVSEEVNGNIGALSIHQGPNLIASLQFNIKNQTTTRTLSQDDIFHVFSNDFIDTELRSNEYEIDGDKIKHEIIVGKENHELDAKQEEVEKINEAKLGLKAKLESDYQNEKDKLKKSFNISSNLGAFKNLNIEDYLEEGYLENHEHNYTKILAKYNKYKSVPAEPDKPEEVDVSGIFFELLELIETLQKPVSISSVANNIREKIISSPTFFENGLDLHQHDGQNCPFCAQSLEEVAIKTIQQYEAYFADTEASTIQLLNRKSDAIHSYIQKCETISIQSAQSATSFNTLKTYFPSFENTELESLITPLEKLINQYFNLKNKISDKTQNVTKSIEVNEKVLIDSLKNEILGIYQRNKEKYGDLARILDSSDGERKKLQRQACQSFVHKFYLENKIALIELGELTEKLSTLRSEIDSLKLNGKDKVEAREQVAETFSTVLKYMFDTKYTFDKDRFVVQRNEDDMTRGGNRTLSDGEKSVFAFCYYIAQIHMKVTKLEDYERIFFVIDDPVSSLSYDYIYNITQFLKTFRIIDGIVKPNEISGSRHRMLILTHNDYFYNLACSCNLVKQGANFQLINNGSIHSLTSLKNFVTPHISHLQHVYKISEGESPIFTSANSVRSVIEGIWKFCHPECQDFAKFLEVLRIAHGISIKSLLINDLSHGGEKYTSPKIAGDITLAAKEAISVVKKFAPGQIESLAN